MSCRNLMLSLFLCRYRNLIERALKARLVYGSPNMNRAVSFEYMNRQLVWNEFSVLLLPCFIFFLDQRKLDWDKSYRGIFTRKHTYIACCFILAWNLWKSCFPVIHLFQKRFSKTDIKVLRCSLHIYFWLRMCARWRSQFCFFVSLCCLFAFSQWSDCHFIS